MGYAVGVRRRSRVRGEVPAGGLPAGRCRRLLLLLLLRLRPLRLRLIVLLIVLRLLLLRLIVLLRLLEIGSVLQGRGVPLLWGVLLLLLLLLLRGIVHCHRRSKRLELCLGGQEPEVLRHRHSMREGHGYAGLLVRCGWAIHGAALLHGRANAVLLLLRRCRCAHRPCHAHQGLCR